MVKLISFLITGCWHHWKIIETVKIFAKGQDSRPIKIEYHLQCDQCGNIKSKRV